MDQVNPFEANRRQRLAAMALAMSMMLASLGTSIANVALPTIADAFFAPFQRVQWVVTAYLLALTVSAVLVGWMGDRFGLKRMLLGGLALFTLASLLCGLAPSLPALIAARFLQGVAAAFLMTLTIALVNETAGDGRTGRAMGLIGTMSALGTALGPALGGVIISVAGWQGVFLIMVPLGLLALISGYTLLTGGGTRTALPRMTLRGLATGGLMPRLTSNLLVAAVMMATLVIGPFYLGFGLGLSTTRLGLVMSVGPVISIFCGVPSGRLVDQFGSEPVILAGLSLLTIGAFSLAVLPSLLGIGGYVTAIALLTPGYQLFLAANNTAVMEGVGRDRRGTTSGLLGLSRNLGLVFGASVLGAVFALAIGSGTAEAAAPTVITFGMQCVFVAAGLLMIVAAGFVRLGRDR